MSAVAYRDGWPTAILGELCEAPQYGFTASAETSGNIRFLRITDITDAGVEWSSVPYCNCPPELIPKYALQSGDIVFARIGATTGKSYLIDDPPPAVFASYLIRIRPNADVDARFLSQFLRSTAYWHQVNSQKHANLKKGVNASFLKTLIVPHPPRPEQERIAETLSLIERAAAEQVRMAALLRDLKRALLSEIFTRGLRRGRTRETDIGPLPEDWELQQLKDLVEETDQVDLQAEGDREIEYIDVSSISRRDLDISSTTPYVLKEAPGRARKRVRTGDVVFATVRPTLLRVARVPAELDNQVCSTAFCVLRDKNRLTAGRFIYYLMQRSQFIAELAALQSGASYPAVTDHQVKSQLVPVPPVDEQAEIAHVLEQCDARSRICEQRAAVLTATFRSLLEGVLTGEVDISNLASRKQEAAASAAR